MSLTIASLAKVLRQETKNRVSKGQNDDQPKLAYDSIKSLQKLRTRLILEESNQVFLKYVQYIANSHLEK